MAEPHLAPGSTYIHRPMDPSDLTGRLHGGVDPKEGVKTIQKGSKARKRSSQTPSTKVLKEDPTQRSESSVKKSKDLSKVATGPPLSGNEKDFDETQWERSCWGELCLIDQAEHLDNLKRSQETVKTQKSKRSTDTVHLDMAAGEQGQKKTSTTAGKEKPKSKKSCKECCKDTCCFLRLFTFMLYFMLQLAIFGDIVLMWIRIDPKNQSLTLLTLLYNDIIIISVLSFGSLMVDLFRWCGFCEERKKWKWIAFGLYLVQVPLVCVAMVLFGFYVKMELGVNTIELWFFGGVFFFLLLIIIFKFFEK